MNKQHILDEIQRTAAANDGRVLGRERVEKETGIKESDWRGKYWARWNGAVNEAGLSPNKLIAPYDDEHLLAKFAAFVRELGRFPTTSEMQLKRRRDADFPSQTVFERFGTKTQQARRVLDYCLDQGSYDDVAALCKPFADQAAADSESDTEDAELDFGFVYLIKSGRYYKIGRSNAAGRREREIALQLPEKAETVHVIRTAATTRAPIAFPSSTAASPTPPDAPRTSNVSPGFSSPRCFSA